MNLTALILALILALNSVGADLPVSASAGYGPTDKATLYNYADRADRAFRQMGVYQEWTAEPNIFFYPMSGGAVGGTQTERLFYFCTSAMAISTDFRQEWSPALLVVVFHERFHAHQGIYCRTNTATLETTATLAAFEAASIAALNGDYEARDSLIFHLRRYAVMAYLILVDREGGDLEQAARAAALDADEVEGILSTYAGWDRMPDRIADAYALAPVTHVVSRTETLKPAAVEGLELPTPNLHQFVRSQIYGGLQPARAQSGGGACVDYGGSWTRVVCE